MGATPCAAICQQPFTLGKELRLKLHYSGGNYNQILGFCSSNDINKIDSTNEIWPIAGFNILVGLWNIYSDGQGTNSGITRNAGGTPFKPPVQGHKPNEAYDV